MLAAAIMIQKSDDSVWWMNIAFVALGLVLIGACERDYLRSQGRLS